MFIYRSTFVVVYLISSSCFSWCHETPHPLASDLGNDVYGTAQVQGAGVCSFERKRRWLKRLPTLSRLHNSPSPLVTASPITCNTRAVKTLLHTRSAIPLKRSGVRPDGDTALRYYFCGRCWMATERSIPSFAPKKRPGDRSRSSHKRLHETHHLQHV